MKVDLYSSCILRSARPCFERCSLKRKIRILCTPLRSRFRSSAYCCSTPVAIGLRGRAVINARKRNPKPTSSCWSIIASVDHCDFVYYAHENVNPKPGLGGNQQSMQPRACLETLKP